MKNQHNETSIKGHPPFLARGKASKSQCKHTLQTYTARKRVHIYIDILKRNRKKNNYEFINLFIFSNFPTLKKNPTLQNLSPSTFQKAPSLESQSSWHPPLGTALVAKEFFQWTSHGDVRSCLGCRLSWLVSTPMLILLGFTFCCLGYKKFCDTVTPSGCQERNTSFIWIGLNSLKAFGAKNADWSGFVMATVAGLQHEFGIWRSFKKSVDASFWWCAIRYVCNVYLYIYICFNIYIYKFIHLYYIYIYMYSLFEILMIEVCHQTNQLPMGQIQESSQPASFCQPLSLKIQLLSQQKQQTCAVSKASSRRGLDRWNISETISSTTGTTGTTGATGTTGITFYYYYLWPYHLFGGNRGGTYYSPNPRPTGALMPCCGFGMDWLLDKLLELKRRLIVFRCASACFLEPWNENISRASAF